MFSSNLVQHPSSIHVFPSSTSLFDLEKDGIHFNHHHHYHHHHNNQFVNGDFYFHAYNSLVPPPVITDNIMVRQQQLCKGSGFHYNNNHNSLLEEVIYPSKKNVANMKKNGHSKIHTAQGPRDRRVRMSIEVARKFFYLQDLLGYDKASETVDWLFTKSKTAIKELLEEMKQCSSPGATDQCEVVFQDILKRRSDEEEEKGQKKTSASKCVDAKNKRKYRSAVDVNQSRAEARARARERTKEKMQNKRLDESKKEYNEKTSESIMEPKIPMSSSVLYGNYQHNVLLANNLSSEIKYTSFLNLL